MLWDLDVRMNNLLKKEDHEINLLKMKLDKISEFENENRNRYLSIQEQESESDKFKMRVQNKD